MAGSADFRHLEGDQAPRVERRAQMANDFAWKGNLI